LNGTFYNLVPLKIILTIYRDTRTMHAWNIHVKT
jgi:hypothetical protein